MNGHMLQYAFVGDYLVYDTADLTDEQVKQRAGRSGLIERFNRCPVCQVWTSYGGQLRESLDCPAIRDRVRGRGHDEGGRGG